LTRTEFIAAAKSWLATRRYAYRTTFKGPLADTVLRDLAKFCCAHASTFHDAPAIQAKLDGRREVWLRIQQHLNLTDTELWNLLDGREG
jgi:hypothetical protein